MSNENTFIIIVTIIAILFVYLGFKNQTTHTTPKNEPTPTVTSTPLPPISICNDTTCQKGA